MTHPQLCSWLKDAGVRLRNRDHVRHRGNGQVYTVPHCADYGDITISLWHEKYRTAVLFPLNASKACELLELHWCQSLKFTNMIMFNRLDIVADEAPLDLLITRLLCEVAIAIRSTQ